MSMNTTYVGADAEPARADVDAIAGPVLVEFGAPWCPHCRGAQIPLAEAMKAHPGVKHIKVEDGRGQPLGRSFSVKLWPTMVFMKGGKEVARLVRPTETQPMRDALAQIDAA